MFTIGHLYLIFLIIGALGLLSSLIFGDVDADGDLDMHGDIGGGDADHGDSDGPKILSLRVIFAFLLAFGIGGGSMYLFGNGLGIQLLVGFLAGIATGAMTFFMMRFLYSFQGNSNIDSNDLIGLTGIITIPTTKTGLAQVKVDSNGADNQFMAQETAGNILKQHDTVKVIGKVGNTLLVTKQ
jgi:membrane protein implicated in regulation of membrane protease activity